MIVFLRIVVITYLVAINVYGFLLIYFQKKSFEEMREKTVKDSKLFLSGMLGGATGIYVAMFVYTYRLQSLFLMIVIPVLIVVNAYIVITAFTGNFGFLVNV